MWHSLLDGVSAAVLTPRTDNDSVAEDEFRRSLYFLLAREIRSFALNGATGEFCLTSPAQLKRILANASVITDFDGQFVVGNETPADKTSIELGRMAADAGAKAVLLPMPYFFSFEQADLRAFVSRVADALSIPVLLYNLPQFTSGIRLYLAHVDSRAWKCSGYLRLKRIARNATVAHRRGVRLLSPCRQR